jgi:hypothetical protein
MSIWTKLLAALGTPKDADAKLAHMERLLDAFEADTDAFLNLTTKLRRGDLHLIGEVVQLYSYADFNARRIASALEHASTGAPMAVSRLQDWEVLRDMEALAREHLPDGNLRDGILKAHGTLLMHRDHRHDFAHWATRRVKGADALVMFSMNAKSAQKRAGTALGAQQSRFGILPLAGFRGEVRKLKGHSNFLAAAASHIDTHIVELREWIAKHRAGEQMD